MSYADAMDDIAIFNRTPTGDLEYAGARPRIPADKKGRVVFDGRTYVQRDGDPHCFDEVERVRREDDGNAGGGNG